ncbi:PH domain-containing protein [Halobacillus salinus]|uniref:PH domain-containing protein n=1 Tax=Halobacillus salinus TaxID=192814 RepID=UPI0009A73335|nr:PH domain-containing protein [Halobacillus salinus]
MPTIEEVRAQMQRIEEENGITLDTFGTKKEVKYLPETLYDNEVIQYLTSGFLDNNTWIIVCTDQRILALDKGMLYGMKQQEIPLENISSVKFKKKLMFAEVEIITSSARIKIENVFKNQVEFFVRTINASRESLKVANTTSSMPASTGVADEIEKLASLHDQGILTDDEFTSKKKQLLGI